MLPVPGAMRPLLTWLGPGSHQLHVDDMFGHPGGAPWSGTNYGGNQPSPAQGFAQPNAGFAQPQGYGSTPAPRGNSPSGYQAQYNQAPASAFQQAQQQQQPTSSQFGAGAGYGSAGYSGSAGVHHPQ